MVLETGADSENNQDRMISVCLCIRLQWEVARYFIAHVSLSFQTNLHQVSSTNHRIRTDYRSPENMDISEGISLKPTYQVLDSALLITTCGRSEHGSLVLAHSDFSPLALLASYSSLIHLLHTTVFILLPKQGCIYIISCQQCFILEHIAKP